MSIEHVLLGIMSEATDRQLPELSTVNRHHAPANRLEHEMTISVQLAVEIFSSEWSFTTVGTHIEKSRNGNSCERYRS